jgi:alkylation response protein AidB-like acyl-CoA dehydrogenase
MPAASATTPTITPEFVARLAERAQDAARLRRLPADTIDDLNESGFTELLVPARYGGNQADFPAILDPVRRMAHGCASSWTIGFTLQLDAALLDERAQRRFTARPRPLPARRAGVPTGEGVRPTGRWSWATGVMHGNWIIVALLPIGAHYCRIEDVWHTDGMRATGSNDVVITDVFVPVTGWCGCPTSTGTARRRAARRRHLSAGRCSVFSFRPQRMPALGTLAERAADVYAELP